VDPVTVAIRPAVPDDSAALGRLGAQLVALHHELNPRRFIAPTEGTAAGYGRFLLGELQREDAVVLVAEVSGSVAGYVYAGVEGPDWMTLRGPAGVIQDIVVDPAHRRHGVGAALLDAVLKALEERGAPRVLLSTAQLNLAAQALFASRGFQPTMIEMTREFPGPHDRAVVEGAGGELLDDGQEEVFSYSAVEQGLSQDPLALDPAEVLKARNRPPPKPGAA